MSPGVRFRLWASFHNAARAEAEGSRRRASYRALSALMAHGYGMEALAHALKLHTSAPMIPKAGPSREDVTA